MYTVQGKERSRKKDLRSHLRIELGTSCAEGHMQIVVIFPELCLSFLILMLTLFLFYSIVMLTQALTLLYF